MRIFLKNIGWKRGRICCLLAQIWNHNRGKGTRRHGIPASNMAVVSFISHYLYRSRCCDGIIEFSKHGARGAKVERPEGVPNCYRQVRERSSFRAQGQRTRHPFLTRALVYRRPTFSRVRFDVEVVRGGNFRFEIVRDRFTRFERISKAFKVITTVCDFPSYPFVVESCKRVILRRTNS